MAEADFQKYLAFALMNPRQIVGNEVNTSLAANLNAEERQRITLLLDQGSELKRFSDFLEKKKKDKMRFIFKESYKFLKQDWVELWQVYLYENKAFPDFTYEGTLSFVDFMVCWLLKKEVRYAKAIKCLAMHDTNLHFFAESRTLSLPTCKSNWTLAANVGLYVYEVDIRNLINGSQINLKDIGFPSVCWILVISSEDRDLTCFSLTNLQHQVLNQLFLNKDTTAIHASLKSNGDIDLKEIEGIVSNFISLKLIYDESI